MSNKNIVNQNRKNLVCGIGINDAPYPINPIINGKHVPCPYYDRWHYMLRRCTDKKYQKRQPTYKGTTVCDDWLYFMSFRAWMEKQDWENKELDKDILTYGTDVKKYSPDTCMFVSKEINMLLTDNKAVRGVYPQGVQLHKNNKYKSRLSKYGKRKHLGYFNKVSEAYKVYIKEKIIYITEIALKQEKKLKNALLTIAEIMRIEYSKGKIL